MIDEDRTLSCLGVDVSTLTHGSNEKVFRVCEECGTYALIVYNQAIKNTLCHPCAIRKMANRPEIRRARSAAKKGRKNNMYGRRGKDAPGYGRHGAAHYNWKGGITKWHDRFHYSLVYKAWRKAVFERDHFTCQMCGDDSGGNLQAHHIKPVRDHKNDLLIVDTNNGITLCEDCHKQIFWHESDFEPFFNAIIENQ